MKAPISTRELSHVERLAGSAGESRGYRFVIWAAACGAIAIGGLAVLGWLIGWSFPLDLFNLGIRMKANGGLGAVLTGIAILALARRQQSWLRFIIGYGSATLVLLLGLLTLLELVMGWSVGIDQLLAHESAGEASTASPGRMGPPAAISFTLLGLALLLIRRRGMLATVAQSCALLVGVIAMLSIVGNLYGVEELFALARYTGISLQTSLALLLLCIGTLCIRPKHGLMVALSSPANGGILVRRLLLPSILLPMLLGWAHGLGVRNGVFDEQFGMAIFALALSMVLTALVLWSGTSLNRAAALRRQAELAVIHNERLYRAIGESINYGIWFCDAQGRNTYVSQTFLDLLGITQEHCSKFGWAEYLHPDDADATVHAWKRCVAQGKIWERAHRFRGREGQWHHMLARGVPIRNDQGEIVAWAGINLDISQLKETEDELRSHKEHLEHLVLERTKQLESSHQALRMSERMAAMGTLVAGLGHDMGNLLLPVRARLDTLEHSQLSDSAVTNVKSIRACVEHLQQLASGLRLFSLDPATDADMQGSTDLASWRVEVEPFMRNALPRGVNLLWGIPDSMPPLHISKHRLTQAVYNLVKNAGDAIAPRGSGSVAVSARTRNDGQVQFDVADDGPGMSDEVRRHCLEPFYTTKKRGLSTGLGLSIVHGIMQRCGGSIHIESKAGIGSTFSLMLPAGAIDVVDQPIGTAIVMIDNPRLSAMVAATLKGNFVVTEANHLNGTDAELCIAEWSPQASSTIKKFLSDRDDRRALLVNCPDDGATSFENEQRLKLISGWPKITELRKAILNLSQPASAESRKVQEKPIQAAAGAPAN